MESLNRFLTFPLYAPDNNWLELRLPGCRKSIIHNQQLNGNCAGNYFVLRIFPNKKNFFVENLCFHKMVDSVVLRTRKVLTDLLVSQEDCDIIFNLKDEVVLKAHSSILSGEHFPEKNKDTFPLTFSFPAHSPKFKVDCRNCPLMFMMDPRIEHSVMWIVLTYMYTGVDYVIQPQHKDSYILLAYFVSWKLDKVFRPLMRVFLWQFDEKKIILDADDFLVKSLSIMTAMEVFYYAIEMKMSYKCKARIFDYIARFVMKLPEMFTLDSVLMSPDVLACAYNCYVEAAGTSSGVVECVEDSNPPLDVLYEQIEEQLDVVGNSDFDPLFEQIEEQLDVVGNAEHDDLFEQIEELLDVVGTSEKEAAATISRHYQRNSGSDFEFF